MRNTQLKGSQSRQIISAVLVAALVRKMYAEALVFELCCGGGGLVHHFDSPKKVPKPDMKMSCGGGGGFSSPSIITDNEPTSSPDAPLGTPRTTIVCR